MPLGVWQWILSKLIDLPLHFMNLYDCDNRSIWLACSGTKGGVQQICSHDVARRYKYLQWYSRWNLVYICISFIQMVLTYNVKKLSGSHLSLYRAIRKPYSSPQINIKCRDVWASKVSYWIPLSTERTDHIQGSWTPLQLSIKHLGPNCTNLYCSLFTSHTIFVHVVLQLL